MIGERLGHYQVLEKIGQGGMGEVFLAEDTKLGRQVALKVLPAEVAEDQDRLERFRREAKVLATLNHPNIGAIYGVEEVGERPFLVLELVDGDELAGVLANGPLSADEALPIALDIAVALAAAHDRGIVHRDLKPANVKRASDGRIKVLDFGLAKAVVADDSSTDLSSSPTAAMSQTAPGVIMGTARYMSPEQARGRAVDARSDIWAFGVVLFEMLTGRPAFDGETLSDVLASVLKDEPDWSRLPSDLSPRIRELLELCLQRDPSERLAHIGDARFWLRGSPTSTHTTRSRRQLLPIIVGAVLAVVGVSMLLWRSFLPAEPAVATVERYVVKTVGFDVDFVASNPVLSPDGTRLLLVAHDQGNGERGLYQRRIDELELSQIEGTEKAGWASFSPDGNQILFFDTDANARNLNRISVHGGPRTIVADDAYVPAQWADDGYVYFPRLGDEPGLYRVSVEGGEPERLTSTNAGGTDRFRGHNGPQLLPGGSGLLFAEGGGGDNGGWNIALLDLGTGSWRPIVEQGFRPFYVGRYIFFSRDQRLWAVPFDAESRELLDEPRPVLEDVQTHPTAPVVVAQAWVSKRGSLAYLRGDVSERRQSALVAVGPNGSREVLLEESGVQLYFPSMSPDGNLLSFARYDGETRQVWTRDVTTGTTTRVSLQAGNSFNPVWSRDGKWIAFSAGTLGAAALYRKEVNGVTERLTDADVHRRVLGWHPDGSILFWSDANRGDILIASAAGDVTPVLATDAEESAASLSPDGRWLAFASNLTGSSEVYVTPFPTSRIDPVPVSADGGREPVWSIDGKLLYYREGFPRGGRIVAVDIDTDPELAIGSRTAFVETPSAGGGVDRLLGAFTVMPDGRLLLAERTRINDESELVIVKNWLSEVDVLFDR